MDIVTITPAVNWPGLAYSAQQLIAKNQGGPGPCGPPLSYAHVQSGFTARFDGCIASRAAFLADNCGGAFNAILYIIIMLCSGLKIL